MMLAISSLFASVVVVLAVTPDHTQQPRLRTSKTVLQMSPSDFSSSFLGLDSSSLSGLSRNEENLVQWLTSKGAEIHGVKIQSFKKGSQNVRGVGATQAFKKGEVVARIPEQVLLHLHDEKTVDLDDRRLVLVAERRKGDASFWASYIQNLPTPEEYKQYYPTFMDKQALQESMKNMGLPEEVTGRFIARQEKLETELAALKALELAKTELAALKEGNPASGAVSSSLVATHPKSLSDLTLEELKWADAIDTSRNFHSEDYHGSVLVPFGDLFLTTEPGQENLQWKGAMEDNYWVLHAAKDIAAGEELTTRYGAKDNERLLRNYGFVLPGNPTKLDPDRSGCTQPTGKASESLPEPFRNNLQALREEFCTKSV